MSAQPDVLQNVSSAEKVSGNDAADKVSGQYDADLLLRKIDS